MKIKNLFFISDELISRKQLFQITDMGYHIWSFVIGQLQSDGFIWNPNRINKLIYTEFFTFSPNHFRIFTQTVIYIYTNCHYLYLHYLHYLSVLSILSIYIIYIYIIYTYIIYHYLYLHCLYYLSILKYLHKLSLSILGR